MKHILLTAVLSLMVIPVFSQEPYLRDQSQVRSAQIVFTEIIIDASPEEVRSAFLDFEKWSEWNSVFPGVKIIQGDIQDVETRPVLALIWDFGQEDHPEEAPFQPIVLHNTPELFHWGVSRGFLIKADHVFLFESLQEGQQTRLVHYEQMRGLLKSFLMSKKNRQVMLESYQHMNQKFQQYCETL